MAKSYSAEELAWRVYAITAASIVAWVAAAFYFVILKQ